VSRARLCSACVLLALLVAARGRAMEIHLAPLVFQDETTAEAQHPSEDLLRRFSVDPLADGVVLRDAVELSGEAPRTYLEAATACESQGYSYLLYGFVKRTEYSYYAELKLLEREHKNVAVAFISGDDSDHYERLMDDLAVKLSGYVRSDLGMAPAPTPREPARDLIALPTSAGWWTPMGGSWSDALAGLATAGMSIRFIPARPLFQLWARPCFLALGLDLAYALGANQPGAEGFFLHAARVRLPVEVYMDLGAGHRVGLGVGPLLEVDAMAKARLYGSTIVTSTVAPGASLSVIYQYTVASAVTVGLANTFDAALYSTPLVSWSPAIMVDLWLGPQGAGR
jgi:hypothetical protein